MKKKKICVIATGGTISSRPSPDGLVPTLTGEDILALVPELGALCEVDCLQVLQLDSSNLLPEHWQSMARAIATQLPNYDGFVVTHGTDTMAYRAAALWYMLENVPKPVVCTGSQLPIGMTGGDAEQNLLTAFHTALAGRAGVWLAFGGRIIYGNAARKMCTRQFTAFDTLNRPLAGRYACGRLDWYQPEERPAGKFRLRDQLGTRVGALKLVPGLPPKILRLFVDEGLHAVIVEGYGSGGIPSQESPLNFLPTLAYARDNGCLIICTTQCLYDGTDLDSYEMGVRAQRLGVIPGGRLSTEALLPRLMLLLAETRDAAYIRQQLQRD